jgi:ATP-dependent Lon protease
VKIAEGQRDDAQQVGHDQLDATTWARRSSSTKAAERTEMPGVATGLAWTPVGGDILFIEATRMAGQGQA